MTKSLILVSHGRFCEELRGSTEMIMGPQDNIYTVALLPEDGPEEFTAKFEAVIEGLDDFLVFADLLGGTPCNVVSRLIMEGRDIDLYAGMNLPMVIEFINASLTGADADYKSRAAESIVKVNDLLAGFDDDEDESYSSKISSNYVNVALP
ncbi:PTS sugar transporter subunit IIA [Streptococcus pneumoniae]|uniref:PTS sugar transporter subunit IIA n=1 Tax=Streptococcus pneumoniae TaxID=1313 RepID=UPI00067CBDCB|nr:PTS sugar transporter subunit IIA [Streptococcus pneumoniae]